MNFALFRRFGAILALSAIGISTGLSAETATIAAETINVRGRAGFIGEVITKLNRGDTVTIVERIRLNQPQAGEPAEWLKIALPANTPVWLHTAYVDPATQTVNATRLKVRGGPGVNFSVLGLVERGTPVKEIRRQGDWMEIEPPEGLAAYISSDLVTLQTPAAPATPPEATSPAPTESPAPAVAETEPAPPEETPAEKPAETETVANEVVTTEIPPVTDVAPPQPETTPAATLPPNTSATIVAEPAPAIATPPTEPNRPLSTDERALQVLEQRTRDGQYWESTAGPDDALLRELPERRRQVVRDGKIRRAISIQAPSDFTLQHVETGLRLNYLYTTSTNFPLKELLGVKVRIKGEEGIDPRWPGTPVLLIKSLEVLP